MLSLGCHVIELIVWIHSCP